jgi:hypothetical protein
MTPVAVLHNAPPHEPSRKSIPCASAGVSTHASRMFLQRYPADRYGLFTTAATGCLRRARGVSARTDTPVPFVMALRWVEGFLSADALAGRIL